LRDARRARRRERASAQSVLRCACPCVCSFVAVESVAFLSSLSRVSVSSEGFLREPSDQGFAESSSTTSRMVSLQHAHPRANVTSKRERRTFHVASPRRLAPLLLVALPRSPPAVHRLLCSAHTRCTSASSYSTSHRVSDCSVNGRQRSSFVMALSTTRRRLCDFTWSTWSASTIESSRKRDSQRSLRRRRR